MKRTFGIFLSMALSSVALGHGGSEPGLEDIALNCGRLDVTPQVSVKIDRTEATLKAVLPNGNQAEGRYVKTLNFRSGETLYVLNTGGTLVAGMSLEGRWFSTVDQIVVRERTGNQYDLAFNVANYATCAVVPE